MESKVLPRCAKERVGDYSLVNTCELKGMAKVGGRVERVGVDRNRSLQSSHFNEGTKRTNSFLLR